MINRPFVVAVEGINGSGKTTVVNMCVDLMAGLGYRVGKTRLPGSAYAPVCADVRNMLDIHGKGMSEDTKTLLYLANYVEYTEKIVQQNRMDVDVLFTDRSVISLLAYQGVMMGYGKIIRTFIYEYIPASAVFPDLLLYLNVNVKDALRRVKKSEGEQNPTVGGFSDKNEEWFKELNHAYRSVISNYTEPRKLWRLSCTADYKQFGYGGYREYVYPRISAFLHNKVIPSIKQQQDISR